jgi:branched-chain amino acid transport system permease protein
MFDIIKSTDILIMVYLGGIASIAGSILGAFIYTILLETLRPLGVWRMVFMPLMLVLLMIYHPRGIMGLREAHLFVPLRDLLAVKFWKQKKKEAGNASAGD